MKMIDQVIIDLHYHTKEGMAIEAAKDLEKALEWAREVKHIRRLYNSGKVHLTDLVSLINHRF